jgi:hypothetical protein
MKASEAKKLVASKQRQDADRQAQIKKENEAYKRREIASNDVEKLIEIYNKRIKITSKKGDTSILISDDIYDKVGGIKGLSFNNIYRFTMKDIKKIKELHPPLAKIMTHFSNEGYEVYTTWNAGGEESSESSWLHICWE